MNTTLKAYLFVAILSVCLMFYMLLPVAYDFFGPDGGVRLWLENSENTGTEFILLLLISTLTAFGLTSLVETLYGRMKRTSRLKIGEIMKSLNFISEEDLRNALARQNIRLSEILVRAGHITPDQQDLGLELQKKENKKIGEIFKELGFITDKELRWALKERNKKIGSILKDMKLVSDYDIDCALMLEKRGLIDKDGKIINLE